MTGCIYIQSTCITDTKIITGYSPAAIRNGLFKKKTIGYTVYTEDFSKIR
jgi:hypothetical protein